MFLPAILTKALALQANVRVDASNKCRLGDRNVNIIVAEVGLTLVPDKTKRENLEPLDGEEVLRKLHSVEDISWSFIEQAPEGFPNFDPMAQHVFAPFGRDGRWAIGTPTTINTNDLLGILMRAGQPLEGRTVEDTGLRARVEELERTVGELAE